MLLQFIRAKCYNGVDYGPGYAEDVADVDPKWARIFLAQGAAVQVVAAPIPPAPPLSTESFAATVESRDPKPATRGKRR
jgi:hypothetical protein